MDEDVSKYFMSSDMFVSMDSIGITKKDYSNAFQYTIDHATVNGKLKGLCWQATPGCFVYRTDIAQKVLGTSDPDKGTDICKGLGYLYADCRKDEAGRL